MTRLIDFVCVRIANELDKYHKTKTIPHDLLDSVYCVEDIEACIPQLSKKHQRIAKKLIKEYSANMEQNIDSLKASLKKEYASALENARSRDDIFWFPHIAQKYRSDINPLRALYYECREMVRTYSPDNEKHVWLAGLITDPEFNHIILDALAHDIKRIERLLKRYYWPLLKHDDSIPLELFHARQLIKDARHYHNFFDNIRNWSPDN